MFNNSVTFSVTSRVSHNRKQEIIAITNLSIKSVCVCVYMRACVYDIHGSLNIVEAEASVLQRCNQPLLRY